MKPISIAGIEIHVEEAENYIQINDCDDEALRAAWPQVAAAYPGFEVVFCYHNRPVPVDFMNEIDAELLESCIEMRLPRKDFTAQKQPSLEITRVTEENFAEFAEFHDQRNPAPDMYWTGRRIKDAFEKWSVFALYDNGQITGYALMAMWQAKQGEIFCIEALDIAIGKVVASTAITHAFAEGKPEILNMVDRGSQEEAISLELGFSAVGYYIAYRINL